MTEKRFTITQDFEEHHRQIRDNGHIIMGCFVEPQAEVIVDVLNQLNDENEQLKIKWKNCSDYNRVLIKENEQLKKELFEARKDYLIETADISDKLYLEDEIEKERKEIFGDNND